MLVTCPHCSQLIWIEEINCKIFRCGIIKETGEQIPSHATRKECDEFLSKGIYGCSKPFKLNDVNEPEICDYL